MTINSINNGIVNKNFLPFGKSNDENRQYYSCFINSSKKQNCGRNLANFGFIAGLLALCSSQFEHNPALTRFEKFGVGLLLFSTFSLLYQSYKIGKNDDNEDVEETDMFIDTYA